MLRTNLQASFTACQTRNKTAFHTIVKPTPSTDAHFINRKYNNNRSRPTNGFTRSRPTSGFTSKKCCWICNKEGHFSTQHTRQEQDDQKTRWRRGRQAEDRERTTAAYTAFLLDCEGEENLDDDSDSKYKNTAEYNDTAYFTMATTLSNQSFTHRLTANAPPLVGEATPASQFLLDRYSTQVFQGIIPDTGAATNSIADLKQFKAL